MGFCYELSTKIPNNFKIALKAYKEAYYFMNKSPYKATIFAELSNVIAKNQQEKDELNRQITETIRERDNLQLQVDLASEELKKWMDDVLCKDCLCCRSVDEAKSLVKGEVNRIPSSSVFRSKRFYKGLTAGLVLMAIIAIAVFLSFYSFALTTIQPVSYLLISTIFLSLVAPSL